MDSPLFPFNVFPPTSPSHLTPNPRRKRTKFIKTTTSGNPKHRKKAEPTASNNITPPCSECGKQFWSWKALFGHMRCHPERQWRGINPPPNFLRPSVAATQLQQDHEIAASLIMLANAPSDGGRVTAEDYKRKPYSGILDLNLPPSPMEEIEQESSSSYSSGIVLDLRLGLN